MSLDPIDKIRINKFYKERFHAYGHSNAKSVDWDSNRNQQMRFELLTKIGDLNGKSILDFGSGLGDLYGYLSKNFKDVDYLGIDVVDDFVNAARMKYPQGNFQLTEFDALNKKFDYIFASGSLTFYVQDAQKFYFDLIKKMYQSANIGVAFNMLDKDYYGTDDYDIKMYMTYSPVEVLDYCKTFAKDVKVICEYVPGDFTVYLYK